jgi:hypothetical protein
VHIFADDARVRFGFKSSGLGCRIPAYVVNLTIQEFMYFFRDGKYDL